MSGTAGRRRRRRAPRRRPAGPPRRARRPGARRAPPAASAGPARSSAPGPAPPPTPRRRGSRRTRAACRDPRRRALNRAPRPRRRTTGTPPPPAPTRPSARPIRPASSPGSRSAASIRYQTTVPGNRDAICPSSVVLPCPAGASASTTRCAPRSSRRPRASPAGAGGANFAERSSRPSPTLHPAPRSRGTRPLATPRPASRATHEGDTGRRRSLAPGGMVAPRGRRDQYAHLRMPVEVNASACVRCGRFRGGRARTAVRRHDPARRGPPTLDWCRHPGSSPRTSTGRCSTPTTGSPLGQPRSSTGSSRRASSSCWSRAVRRAGSRRSSPELPVARLASARTAPCSTTPSTTGALVADALRGRAAELAEATAEVCPAAGWPSSGSGRARTTRSVAQFVAEPAYVHAWPNPDHASVERSELLDRPAIKMLVRAPSCPATRWWRRSPRWSGTSPTSRSPTPAASWRCRCPG